MLPKYIALFLAVLAVTMNILVVILYKKNSTQVINRLLFVLFVIGLLLFFASLSWVIL